MSPTRSRSLCAAVSRRQRLTCPPHPTPPPRPTPPHRAEPAERVPAVRRQLCQLGAHVLHVRLLAAIRAQEGGRGGQACAALYGIVPTHSHSPRLLPAACCLQAGSQHPCLRPCLDPAAPPTLTCACLTLPCTPEQEDPYNAIAAGALTGGFLQLRFGLRSAAKSAAFGGFLLVSTLCVVYAQWG